MNTFCKSFPPVAAEGCHVLVLGSMPGVASLTAQQYYAHPRNAFWPILYALWEVPAPSPVYADKLSFALAHGIAIWDVAKQCEREGSSDAAMRGVVANDFSAFFVAYPGIHTIFFNGRQAMALFDRLARDAAAGRAKHLLPSTSPAYTVPFAEKLAAWRPLRTEAERGIMSALQGDA